MEDASLGGLPSKVTAGSTTRVRMAHRMVGQHRAHVFHRKGLPARTLCTPPEGRSSCCRARGLRDHVFICARAGARPMRITKPISRCRNSSRGAPSTSFRPVLHRFDRLTFGLSPPKIVLHWADPRDPPQVGAGINQKLTRGVNRNLSGGVRGSRAQKSPPNHFALGFAGARPPPVLDQDPPPHSSSSLGARCLSAPRRERLRSRRSRWPRSDSRPRLATGEARGAPVVPALRLTSG